MPVPVSSTVPSGTGFSRTHQPASSSSVRCSLAVLVPSSLTSVPAASQMRTEISSGAAGSSGTRTAGPIAQHAAKSFACGM